MKKILVRILVSVIVYLIARGVGMLMASAQEQPKSRTQIEYSTNIDIHDFLR